MRSFFSFFVPVVRLHYKCCRPKQVGGENASPPLFFCLVKKNCYAMLHPREFRVNGQESDTCLLFPAGYYWSLAEYLGDFWRSFFHPHFLPLPCPVRERKRWPCFLRTAPDIGTIGCDLPPSPPLFPLSQAAYLPMMTCLNPVTCAS